MARIKISSGTAVLICELLETPTAAALPDLLPLEGRASLWGEEVYFSTPLQIAAEADARDLLEAGEIAYWPPGNAICICFGPTPVSTGSELRLASAANIFARTDDDVSAFAAVKSGATVRVELSD